MATPQFAMRDTKLADGFYVQLERAILDDDTAGPPDKMSDGFWPSQNKESAGYVGEVSEKQFKAQMTMAKRRMTNWERGHWRYVGVRARALCLIVRNGVGVHLTIESPGVWGIESDCGADLNEVYQEEIEELKDMIAAMQNPIYS